jgi:hypothetical protein
MDPRSMDPRSMDPLSGPGPWAPSMDRVHGPPPWAAFFQISILLLNMIRVFNLKKYFSGFKAYFCS